MAVQLAFAAPHFPIRLNHPRLQSAKLNRCVVKRKVTVATIAAPISPPLYVTIDPLSLVEADSSLLPPRRKRIVNPVVIIPGYGGTANGYASFRDRLINALPLGTDVTVVPLTLWAWAGTLTGRPVTTILRLVDATVRNTLMRTGASHVTLVGHSAGGWIGRLYLGDSPYPDLATGTAWQGRTYVRQLVCLGTPHASGERATKRNMSFVNNEYPGAFYDSVEYLNFAGDAVTLPETAKEVPHWAQFWHPLWVPRLSYRLTDPFAKDEYAHIGDGKLSSIGK